MLISEDEDNFYSEYSGNICVFTALKFVGLFIKNMRKTYDIFEDSKFSFNLYCDYDEFFGGYIGSSKNMNEIVIGNSFNLIDKIKVKYL